MQDRSLIDGRLEVRTGNITALHVDAIVNAANSSLLAECRHIRCTELPDGLPPGRAVATAAGKLLARYVIHTVGPVWHGGTSGEPELLASYDRTSLELAASLGGEESVQTVAFPAISTGVFGFPKYVAARITCQAISSFLVLSGWPRQVILVFFLGDDA